MTPKINAELCIGCGTCEGICPEVFKLDDGKAHVIDGVDYNQFEANIKQAVESCPVQAISIE